MPELPLKKAIRTAEEPEPVYPEEIVGKTPKADQISGLLGWMRQEWDLATETPEKKQETKEIIALCMIVVLVVAAGAAFIVGVASARESGSTVAPISIQASITPLPTIQALELTATPSPLQSAAETQTVAMAVVANAPEPIKAVLPSWATQECVLRIAGTTQGEAGGLESDAWYGLAQEIAWDSHQCHYRVVWAGGAPGTGNEVHIYDFECKKSDNPACTLWNGRASSRDNRTLDKGMVIQVLETDVKTEMLDVVTQSLIDFGTPDKAIYPDCEFIDNKIKVGTTVDYIFTGAGHRTTETGAEYFMNCPSGK